MLKVAQCTLPYPDRFQVASQYVHAQETEGKLSLKDDPRLALYALHQQAVKGPCRDPKPWGWNVVESAKWQSWSQLGEMAPVEAMRLYMRLLESEQPDWWERYQLLEKEARSKPPAPATQAPMPAPAQPSSTQQPQGVVAAITQGVQSAAHAVSDTLSVAGSSLLKAALRDGQWVQPQMRGDRIPVPRYEHACALKGHSMYVVGGNCGGRYLNDVWQLDLDTLAWSNLQVSGRDLPASQQALSASSPQQPPPTPQSGAGAEVEVATAALPPSAGHVLVAWGSNLLSVGGHTKAGTYSQLRKVKDTQLHMTVRTLDTHQRHWCILTPRGKAPPQRGGHSGTLLGSRLFLFGGEDVTRRPQATLYVLDLADMEWQTVEATGVAPAARSAHVAAAYKGRYLVIFGGGSVAHCFSDLHVLDTETMEWSQPPVEGDQPSARAGHAADVLGDTLYVAGGGNNTSGCTDLVSLDLSPLSQANGEAKPLRWTVVAQSEARAPTASEGLSLVTSPSSRCLIAFGGYNGKYHNIVQAFRPAGMKSHLSPKAPAAQPQPVQQQPHQKPQHPVPTGFPSKQPAVADTAPSSPQQQQQAVGSAGGAADRAASEQQQYQRHLEAASAANAALREKTAASSKQTQASAQGPAKANSATQTKGAPQGNGVAAPDSEALQERIQDLEGLLQEAENRAALSAREAAAARDGGPELSLTRRQLHSAQAALAEAEQSARKAEEALAEEQGRVVQLEVANAELRQKLGSMQELEKEVTHLRKLARDWDARSQTKGINIWGYVSGA